MTKVAHFIDSDDPGGAETLIIDLVKALTKRGYEPEVYLFGNSWLEEHCQKYEIPFHIVPYESLYRSKYTLPFFILLFTRYLKNKHIHYIHTHLFDTVLPTSIAARILNIPHIATLHDKYSIEDSPFRISVLKFAARLGTLLVPVSRDIKTLLVANEAIDDKSLQVIYNGVDVEKFDRLVKAIDIHNLDLTPDVFVFICVARLIDLKAHDVLIEAFERLVKQGYPVKLLLAGDGPLMGTYQKAINDRDLNDYIRLLGQRGDVAELLKSSDCFVLASMSEGLSCSIIEAMAASLPVIATNVGGNPELVNEEENGYLVQTRNVDALYEKLLIMVNNKEKAQVMGEASRKRVISDFTLEAMVEKYIRLYKQQIQ
ncbi:MAG TPA: glycosyltransferase [Gammaproteobacteria bacterium]